MSNNARGSLGFRQKPGSARSRRQKFVNRRGWWGIALHASWITLVGLVITALTSWAITGRGTAAWSAVLAGGVVWVLSVLTTVTTAVVWNRWREAIMGISIAALVMKLILLGIILSLVPAPAWIETIPAAIAALVAILLWQVSEIWVFMNTRYQLYSDT